MNQHRSKWINMNHQYELNFTCFTVLGPFPRTFHQLHPRNIEDGGAAIERHIALGCCQVLRGGFLTFKEVLQDGGTGSLSLVVSLIQQQNSMAKSHKTAVLRAHQHHCDCLLWPCNLWARQIHSTAWIRRGDIRQCQRHKKSQLDA